MRILFIGFGLLGAAALLGPARAQTILAPDIAARPVPQAPRVTRAPAAPARRQPRVTEVPERPEAVDPSANSLGALDDEALQRKISGICRGC